MSSIRADKEDFNDERRAPRAAPGGIAFGVLILSGGVAETIGAFWCRGWSGFFVHFLSGLLSIVIALMFLRAPVGAIGALTLIVAYFLIVGGTSRSSRR